MANVRCASNRGAWTRRLTHAGRLLVWTVAVAGCSAPRDESRPVTVAVVTTPSGFGFQLNASSGVKINARLKPTLELAGGGIIAFHASRLTADSAYFVDPPRADLHGTPRRVAGTLRVSVCHAAASICQTVVIPIDQTVP